MTLFDNVTDLALLCRVGLRYPPQTETNDDEDEQFLCVAIEAQKWEEH
jgi:hypothetical protein